MYQYIFTQYNFVEYLLNHLCAWDWGLQQRSNTIPVNKCVAYEMLKAGKQGFSTKCDKCYNKRNKLYTAIT